MLRPFWGNIEAIPTIVELTELMDLGWYRAKMELRGQKSL